jgi:hypothetical protein
MSMPAPPSEDTIHVGGDGLSVRVTSEDSGGPLASAHGIELTRAVGETA